MTRWLLVLVLVGTIIAASSASRAAASPGDPYYGLPTVSYTPQICTGVGCDVAIKYNFAGDGTCLACQPGDPYRVGSFSLTFTPNRFFPNDPIKARSGIGTLSVLWADSTTTTATYNFKARDSKTFALSGQITDSTNTRFTTGTAVDGLVGLPPNPVEPGTTAAAISFG